MEKINRPDIYNVITPDNQRLARQTFKRNRELRANDKNFIKEVTSKKIEEKSTVGEKRIISARIKFTSNRLNEFNTMAEVLSDRLGQGEQFSRIIAEYLKSKKSATAELSL